MTIAWVFPGQGSQKIGMADSVIDLPGAKDRFDLASQILGRDLMKICSGEELHDDQISDLNDTRNTQPALFVVESLLIDDLRRQGKKASLVAGHSLGELVALYSAEVFDAQTGLKLLKKRSELMAGAGGGAMAAILGFDRNQLEEIVLATQGVVIANDNSSSQVVISGTPEAVETVTSNVKCKRAVPLNVSGAFHSPFMKEASQAFSKDLDDILFNDPVFPVISNFNPIPESNGSILKENLKQQMTNGVRWRETMNAMIDNEISVFVEIGPGNVLSGLAKRSLTGVSISQIASTNDLGY